MQKLSLIESSSERLQKQTSAIGMCVHRMCPENATFILGSLEPRKPDCNSSGKQKYFSLAVVPQVT
jgi:hypothetical protein